VSPPQEAEGDKTHLEPNDDQVPETNHADLGRRESRPGVLVLDCYDIHEVKNELHCKEGRHEAHEISGRGAFFEIDGFPVLRSSLAYCVP
jgi:hypothetical protein